MDILLNGSLQKISKNSSVIYETFLDEVLKYISKYEQIQYLSWETKVLIHSNVKMILPTLERNISRHTMWKNFRKGEFNIRDRTVDQQHSTEDSNDDMFIGRRQIWRTLFGKLVSMFTGGQSKGSYCV